MYNLLYIVSLGYLGKYEPARLPLGEARACTTDIFDKRIEWFA